jgi:hypothetical protein
MNAPNIRPDILTHSGDYFDFINPECCEIHIEDIAHALSHICRFNGHTHTFYSVAQHSVHVSKVMEWILPEAQMEGLLHDAAEAFIGDVTRPLKQLLQDYKAIEQRVERALFQVFGIAYPLSQSVKYADLILLATEQRDLMPTHDDQWALIKDVKPLQEHIVPWTSEQAFREFMRRYEELGGVV